MILLLVTLILFSGYALLFLFYKKAWDRLSYFEPQHLNKKPVFVSVLIAARNEENNIEILLRSLVAQSYSKDLFEIILIDDHSEDSTVQKAAGMQLANLKIVQLKNETSKKKALQEGIKHASGTLIVTTDADCIVPPNWLNTIVDFYTDNNSSFIAAPVAYRYKNSLVEIIQTIDFITLQGITAASVHANFYSMCNGANLAYTKQAFADVNGFEGIDKVASGDDMLLMYKIWKQNPQSVHYLKSKDAIVQTNALPTWKQFFAQRIRWASKTVYYDDKKVFWSLLLIYLFNAVFVVLVVAGFWNRDYWYLFLFLLIAKTAIEFPLVYATAKFYGQQNLLRYFFFLQPLHIFYTVSIGLLSQFGKYSWKGRRIK